MYCQLNENVKVKTDIKNKNNLWINDLRDGN